MPGLQITFCNRQKALRVERRTLLAAARRALEQAPPLHGSLSIVVVDDRTIHALNRQFLGHDYATDVLSFRLESGPGLLVAEVIASAETARRRAAEFGQTAEKELLLYVIHGVLHLLGFDDHTAQDRRVMRAKERECLRSGGKRRRGDAETRRTRRQARKR